MIIGPNGAGKTTLFNIISGAHASTSGRIELFGNDITHAAQYVRARMGLARTFQITNLFSGLTVYENVLIAMLAARGSTFAMQRSPNSDKDLARSAENVLEHWGLSAIAHKEARTISYGEKRQVDLMLAMAVHPRILLLDEPTAGLSAPEVVSVVGMICSLPKEMTVLMIEHDMEVAFEIADQISVLNQGQLVVEGDVEKIRNDPLVADIYLGTE